MSTTHIAQMGCIRVKVGEGSDGWSGAEQGMEREEVSRRLRCKREEEEGWGWGGGASAQSTANRQLVMTWKFEFELRQRGLGITMSETGPQ